MVRRIKRATMDARFQAITEWLRSTLPASPWRITPASADASFRRYFRVRADGHSYILMDAPPDKEDCRPFVEIGRALAAMGLNVPLIDHSDLEQGFLLLSDLGEQSYLTALNEASADRLYQDAIDSLLQMQCAGQRCPTRLPSYGRNLLLNEMALFRNWLLDKQLALALSGGEASELEALFQLLADNALTQPQVWVHRDYHSRNLMVCHQTNPGILDFQDAVVGALSYDLVSLLRDCYIEWPESRQQQWIGYYLEAACRAGLLSARDSVQFQRWFDLMGVQRHLKAAGIFARLYHRDGKPGYLKDIPRTLGYIVKLAGRYPPLEGLAALIVQRVLPALSVQGYL